MEDLDTVRKILPTIHHSQLNRIESNRSILLHIATIRGHIEGIRLLLNDSREEK